MASSRFSCSRITNLSYKFLKIKFCQFLHLLQQVYFSIKNLVRSIYFSKSSQLGGGPSLSETCVSFFGGGSHNFDSADIALVVPCIATNSNYKNNSKIDKSNLNLSSHKKIYLEILKDFSYKYIG